MRQFAAGLDEILVVEEKRQLIEYQLKEQLYNWREDVRPRVIGKYDDKGEWELPMHEWLLPAAGELTPAGIARVIAQRIARFHISARIIERARFPRREGARPRAAARRTSQRVPHYCSGCPHNTSTRVPEGSRALAGIGCHYMATWIHPADADLHARWAARARPGSGRRRSPRRSTCSPTSATAPTPFRHASRSARRSRRK